MSPRPDFAVVTDHPTMDRHYLVPVQTERGYFEMRVDAALVDRLAGATPPADVVSALVSREMRDAWLDLFRQEGVLP